MRDNVSARRIECDSFELDAEFAAIELLEESTIVICCYRAPSGNVENFFEALNSMLSKLCPYKRKILVGDFNLNFSAECNDTLICKNICLSYDMCQLPHGNTRITSHSATKVDSIFTNIPVEHYKTDVIDVHVSDHCAILTTISNLLSKQGQTFIYKKIINEKTLEKLKLQLQQENWNKMYNCKREGIHEPWGYFMNRVSILFNECFPLKKVVISKNRKPKLESRDLQECKRLLDILSIMVKTNPDNSELYKLVKKKYRQILAQERKTYYANKLIRSDNESKTIWSIVKETCGQKKQNSLAIPGDPNEVANRLNTFFIETPANLVRKL